MSEKSEKNIESQEIGSKEDSDVDDTHMTNETHESRDY